jgi:hypothetical protein
MIMGMLRIEQGITKYQQRKNSGGCKKHPGLETGYIGSITSAEE